MTQEEMNRSVRLVGAGSPGPCWMWSEDGSLGESRQGIYPIP